MSKRRPIPSRGRQREADSSRLATRPSPADPGCTIRTADTADAPVIARFNRAMALETEARKLNSKRVLKGVTALLADPAKGTYYVAETGGQIIGQLLITYEWSDWRNGNFWWIQSVFVAPKHRGHGVFKALHAHVETLARSRPDVCGLRLYVDAHNTQAKGVYARLGLQATHYELWETDFILR